MADGTPPEEPRVLHCWEDENEWTVNRYGWGSDEHLALLRRECSNGTCMREAGHDGEHDFTPDDQIGVTFA